MERFLPIPGLPVEQRFAQFLRVRLAVVRENQGERAVLRTKDCLGRRPDFLARNRGEPGGHLLWRLHDAQRRQRPVENGPLFARVFPDEEQRIGDQGLGVRQFAGPDGLFCDFPQFPSAQGEGLFDARRIDRRADVESARLT